MKRVLSTLALGASMLLAATCSQAETITNRATASGPAESPPNGSPGNSVATIIIDSTAMTMSVDVPFADLLSNSVMAHIHCCTTAPFSGTAPVATPFTDFPTGATSGSYTHTFDLKDPSSYSPDFLKLNGGTVDAARAIFLSGIAANEAYLNIHTTEFPAGEIRGFLVQVAAIPEPASFAMLGLGLAGLGLCARRRKT